MRLAIVGLGRMGMNMARRLLQGGHEVVACNRSPDKTDRLGEEGAIGAYSLPHVVEKLISPRVVWMMLPAGEIIDEHIEHLKELLEPGDIVIDGANTYYKDDMRRSKSLAEQGIHFLDAGVSGGIWGLKAGYCLMLGGEKAIYEKLLSVFKTLAPAEGFLYCGPAGAGHFVKMVHNGIEYGMMQAYGEGFQLLEASPYASALNYGDIAHLWNRGSVVRSWLLELAEGAFREDLKLDEITGYVEDSGEGRWTVQQAVETGVPVPVMALSLFQRFRSRQRDPFADRVIAALRREFGGHSVALRGEDAGK
jgi:6-phosphogluconate dehydrogenase